ncbi:MAG TPA: hypothetical protein VKV69_09705, partial [Actinomycetota bacterium]|nr:hypothetical protein [Actinomycetota bacterium]
VQGKTIHKKTTVKGITLAHTGPISLKFAILGGLLLLIGLAPRVRRVQLATPFAERVDDSGSAYLALYDSFVEQVTRGSDRIKR